MKKIVISESQLKRLTKSLVTEQTKLNLGGLPVSLDLSGDVKTNPNFGTLTFNIGGKTIKVRLFTTKFGNVNIVELKPKEDGAYIKTLKGREENLDNEMISKLVKFVQSQTSNDIKLDSSFLVGDLKAKKI
jgi:hypothetical protein